MKRQKSIKDMTVSDFLDEFPEPVLLKWLRAGLRSSERKRAKASRPLSKTEEANKLLKTASEDQIKKIFEILVRRTKN